MNRTFLPKASSMPWRDQYRPLYRWYSESPWTLVPGGLSYPTSKQAENAADAYMATKLNPPIRAEKKAKDPDTLGRAQWHEQRAAVEAERQERVLGAVIIRGKPVAIERRRVRA
jgi:hypothetical protein